MSVSVGNDVRRGDGAEADISGKSTAESDGSD